ncbi:hypothetical protein [Aureibacillus halotolerans]|nr:hypothetical protein [Aureibacillus halotolerans]
MKTKQKPEKLTEKELRELMDIDRQTYERRSGVVRRKGGVTAKIK